MLLLSFLDKVSILGKYFLILAASVSPLVLLSLVLADHISHQTAAALQYGWGALFSSCT